MRDRLEPVNLHAEFFIERIREKLQPRIL